MARRLLLALITLLLLPGAQALAQEPDGGDALRRAINAINDRSLEIQQGDQGFEGLTRRGLRAADWADELTGELESLRERRQRIDERVASSGMSSAIRLVMRRYRTALPDIQQDEREISRRDDEISAVDLQLIEIEKERVPLDNLDEAVRH